MIIYLIIKVVNKKLQRDGSYSEKIVFLSSGRNLSRVALFFQRQAWLDELKGEGAGSPFPPLENSRHGLWVGNGIFFGLFFLFSVPAALLHHLGHHLSAVEGGAGFLSLHHLPHHVPKGHPLATALKFLLGLFLFLSHFRFSPFLGEIMLPTRVASFTYRTEMPEERLHDPW
jgi:hypothetical protein